MWHKQGFAFYCKMWTSLLILAVSSTSLLVSSFGYDDILGKGQWSVDNILQCADPDKYILNLDLTRQKINRTHDCFNLYISNLDREINDTYGIELVIFQKMDGGFKYHSTVTDDHLCTFVSKYTGSNWEKILSLANIDPPKCPIPPGEIKVNKFVMNYTELVDTAVFGVFDVHAYITLAEERLACARMMIVYEKKYEDD